MSDAVKCERCKSNGAHTYDVKVIRQEPPRSDSTGGGAVFLSSVDLCLRCSGRLTSRVNRAVKEAAA